MSRAESSVPSPAPDLVDVDLKTGAEPGAEPSAWRRGMSAYNDENGRTCVVLDVSGEFLLLCNPTEEAEAHWDNERRWVPLLDDDVTRHWVDPTATLTANQRDVDRAVRFGERVLALIDDEAHVVPGDGRPDVMFVLDDGGDELGSGNTADDAILNALCNQLAWLRSIEGHHRRLRSALRWAIE
jgi:hypothetical protein